MRSRTASLVPRLLIAGVLPLAVIALAACASTPGGGGIGPVDDYRGLPECPTASVGPDDAGFGAAWLDDGAQFAVIASGSSGCPPVGESATVGSGNDVTVALVEYPADRQCTMDFVPHTTVFDTPEQIDRSSDLTVTIGDATLTLPGLTP